MIPDYSLHRVWHVLAWSFQDPGNGTCTCYRFQMTVKVLSHMYSHQIGENSGLFPSAAASLCEALMSGIHPLNDFEGNPLPVLHSKFSGRPIAGPDPAPTQSHTLRCLLQKFWPMATCRNYGCPQFPGSI